MTDATDTHATDRHTTDRPPTESGTLPFRYWVWDGWCDPVDPATLPPLDAPAWEAHYANDAERRKHTSRHLDAFPPPLPAVFARLRGLAGEWSARLGYPVCDDPTLHGGGVHLTEPGGWLNAHLDYSLHPRLPLLRRALNLILFLNPGWRPGWGGALALCDPMGNVVRRVQPAPGRLVAFEVSDLSYHAVEPTAPDAAPRLTAAVYYLAVAGPHDTRRRALFLPSRG
jgi:hypothetical protein